VGSTPETGWQRHQQNVGSRERGDQHGQIRGVARLIASADADRDAIDASD
jgi:hypothetical protein